MRQKLAIKTLLFSRQNDLPISDIDMSLIIKLYDLCLLESIFITFSYQFDQFILYYIPQAEINCGFYFFNFKIKYMVNLPRVYRILGYLHALHKRLLNTCFINDRLLNSDYQTLCTHRVNWKCKTRSIDVIQLKMIKEGVPKYSILTIFTIFTFT